jgi:ABC-type sugar transport system permease subunit
MTHSGASSTAGATGGLTNRGGRRKPATLGGWSQSDTFAAAILLVPALILFSITVLYPLVDTIRLGFFDVKGLAPPKWVGLGNYIKLFGDPAFIGTIGVTLLFTIAVTTTTVLIGWGMAILCAMAPRQTRIARLMMFIAFGISDAVVGFMWLIIFRPDEAGLLNTILRGIGLGNLQHAWLGDPATAIWAIIATATWSGVGLPLLVCFAAVQSIPKNMYEAAEIDGARPLAMIRHIIIPLSMPGVRVSIFINLLGALRAFDVIFVMTSGGPVRSTETVGYFMFRESFAQFKLGYGAAATLVLLAAVLTISVPAIIERTAVAK